MVEDTAFSHKIDYVVIINLKGIKIALLVQELLQFAEGVNFAYWWRFRSGGSAIKGNTLSLLRTSSAEVRQKKRCRIMQIAQPPRHL